MRIRMDVAYDGGDFFGWARQPGLRTVQETLESALATVLRLPRVPVTCAGRTDTGVHARGQVVHFDVPSASVAAVVGHASAPPLEMLVRRLNGLLARDLRIRCAIEAGPGFEARFGALWRRYTYRLVDAAVELDPLVRGHVLAWPRTLDVDAMDRAAQTLTGEHDFAAFCKRRDGATTVRTLWEFGWRRDDGLVTANVRADAFCHSMVRALVGCTIEVGEGRRPVTWAAEVLAGGERHPAVRVVPAHGLVLEDVHYPPDDELAAQAQRARVWRTLPEENP